MRKKLEKSQFSSPLPMRLVENVPKFWLAVMSVKGMPFMGGGCAGCIYSMRVLLDAAGAILGAEGIESLDSDVGGVRPASRASRSAAV